MREKRFTVHTSWPDYPQCNVRFFKPEGRNVVWYAIEANDRCIAKKRLPDEPARECDKLTAKQLVHYHLTKIGQPEVHDQNVWRNVWRAIAVHTVQPPMQEAR